MKKTGMMEIAMCNGIILADAKTGMVDLRSVERLGMAMAGVDKMEKYSKRVSLWLELEDTKEFIKTLLKKSSVTEEEILHKEGKRNFKLWGNLMLTLKYAMYLNKELEIEVLETFIENKILYFRILGIDHYKELNNAIDTLEDRTLELKPKGNRGCYINISKAINVRINGEFVKGWDEENADSSKTKLRDKILEECKTLIKKKFIKTYPALKEFIENYEEV